MDAYKYIGKVNKICADHEDGRCNDQCPLKKLSCGFPKDKKDIDKVVALLEEYEQKAQELKPCPFCAGIAELKNMAVNNHAVYCAVCEAQTRLYYPTAEKASEAWNHRVNLIT